MRLITDSAVAHDRPARPGRRRGRRDHPLLPGQEAPAGAGERRGVPLLPHEPDRADPLHQARPGTRLFARRSSASCCSSRMARIALPFGGWPPTGFPRSRPSSPISSGCSASSKTCSPSASTPRPTFPVRSSAPSASLPFVRQSTRSVAVRRPETSRSSPGRLRALPASGQSRPCRNSMYERGLLP